ncbi:MAG: hypothetical protein GF353_07480, partial [Candidatus Lokiarchaeota archaeon]|nr:hypothetical protein [Candidatus Lokiarchaeota archaeon]
MPKMRRQNKKYYRRGQICLFLFKTSKIMKTYYDKELKKVLKDLKTKKKEGLSESEAKKRLEKYGKNRLEEKEKISPVKLFFQQFKSPLVWILIAALIISVIVAFIEKSQTSNSFKEFTDAIVILVILILNAILGFI